MIAHSGIAKLAALAVAGGIHAALAVSLIATQPPMTDGVGGAEVRLGNSIADLVGSSAPAQAAAPTTTPETPAQRPADTQQRTADTAKADVPQPAPVVTSERSKNAETAAHMITPHLGPVRMAALTNTPPTRAAHPVRQTTTAQTSQAAVGDTAQPTPADQPPSAVVAGQIMQAHAPDTSPRPTARPDPTVKAAKATQPAKEPRQAATQAARAGSAQGIVTAAAITRGSGGARDTSGSAAATNYPGAVMRCISRAGRPRVAAKGTAVISFQVDTGGRVTQVGLATSSGNGQLDRAALQIINRAGPCPAPPQGARTGFSIRVQGR